MAIPFVHIEARGSYRELGRAVGEGARDEVCASVAFFRDNFAAMTEGRLTFADAEGCALAYAEHARRALPDHWEELEGLAEGAGLAMSELLVLNCGEEFTCAEPVAGLGVAAPGSSAGGDHCTAVAVSSRGRHIVGHNMDWYVIDAVNNVFFDLTDTGGTRVMGIAGAPYLLMLGMNSHGIASVSNSVHSTDNRVGIPNVFVRRATLSAPSVTEARARGLIARRARGTNHLLADTDGVLWDVETSATASTLIDRSAEGFVAHTNHYVSQEMQPFEGSDHEESRVRLTTAERMLAQGIDDGDDPVDLVARVLRCHEPSPDRAICGHPDESQPPADQGMTVGSMICDLDERRIHVCAGAPCENAYQTFEM